MTKPQKPLLAYAVCDFDERNGDIYFARHRIVAHKAGASVWGDGELTAVECRRVPWADQFAETGHVPWAVRIDHGWWIECSGCGQMIREDAEDDDGESIEFDIVESGQHVFCRPDCEQHFLAEREETRRITAQVVGDLTDRLLRTLPGAVIAGSSHVYVPSGPKPRVAQQGVIHFAFPGMRYGLGSFRFDKVGEEPTVQICYGDRAAFYIWQQAGYPPHLMDAGEAA
jgi:hypothetical protein